MNFFQRFIAKWRGEEQTRMINGSMHSTVRHPDGTEPDGKPKPPRGYIMYSGSATRWYEVPQ